MFLLMLTVCASAGMTDCEMYSVVDAKTRRQCEMVAAIYSDTLGDGPEKNYWMECFEYDPEKS